MRNPRTETLIEDARWLLGFGEHPENVARRVGVTIHALDVALRRAGYHHPDVMAAAGRARHGRERKAA